MQYQFPLNTSEWLPVVLGWSTCESKPCLRTIGRAAAFVMSFRHSSSVTGAELALNPGLQIRASPCTAPPGHTFWSAPVQLDALGAAAVVVVPAALAARDATPTDANSAIVVSVTAVEVTGCSVAASD